MYTERILDLFKNPINAGGLKGANGVGKYVDDSCQDTIKIYLKIDENKIITEARFKAVGGVCTIVAGSAICSCLIDCNLDEAQSIDSERIYQVTGAFPKEKEYAIVIAQNAVKNAIANYFSQEEKNIKKTVETVKVEQKNVSALKTQNKEIASEVSQRRTVSPAKAAFDALFDI